MLSGRLGLDKARIAYGDRWGFIWLDQGRLEVEAGCLRFVTKGGVLPAGDYQVPRCARTPVGYVARMALSIAQRQRDDGLAVRQTTRRFRHQDAWPSAQNNR